MSGKLSGAITGILTAAVVCSMGWGSVSLPLLLFLAVGGGVLLACVGHAHGHLLDDWAQRSPLAQVHPGLKVCVALLLLMLCVTAHRATTGLTIALLLAAVLCICGKIKPEAYVHLLCIPVSFVLVGTLALLWGVYAQPCGQIALPVWGRWLCVTQESRTIALLVLSRALGGLGCMYAISLTTPMTQLIPLLRSWRVPEVMIELMYLMYRYLFVLLDTYHQSWVAAHSRMGFDRWPDSVHTMGMLLSRLLGRSFARAGACWDAMESRCYEGKLCFLETLPPLQWIHVGGAVGLLLAGVLVWLW